MTDPRPADRTNWAGSICKTLGEELRNAREFARARACTATQTRRPGRRQTTGIRETLLFAAMIFGSVFTLYWQKRHGIKLRKVHGKVYDTTGP